MNVVIAVAKCSRAKNTFGIRIEEISHATWEANWAFPLKDDVAKREGYTSESVRGTFQIGADYPSCPYCEATSIFYCQCHRVACWNGRDKTVTCPWCHTTVVLGGKISELRADHDY